MEGDGPALGQAGPVDTLQALRMMDTEPKPGMLSPLILIFECQRHLGCPSSVDRNDKSCTIISPTSFCIVLI